MNPIIKKSIVSVMRARQRNHWKAPDNRVKLTAAEKKQVDEVWGGHGQSPAMAGMSTSRV